tara:strand:- start:400 stop:639 length:240 start_codon:yes stop_codon:yes gene_type:complete
MVRFRRIDSWYSLGSFRVVYRELQALWYKGTMAVQYVIGYIRRNCYSMVDGIMKIDYEVDYEISTSYNISVNFVFIDSM